MLISTPQHDHILEKVERLLANQGIFHLPLSIHRDTHHNLSVGDGANVFIKVYRTSAQDSVGGDGFLEVSNASLAQASGAKTPISIYSNSWCSVWVHENIEPLPAERIGELITSMRDFHQQSRVLIKNKQHFFDLDKVVETMLYRTRDVQHPLISGMSEAIDNLAYPLYLHISNSKKHSFIHGDLHLGNTGARSNGDIVIYDWELACISPPEIELSQTLATSYDLFTDPIKDIKNLYDDELDEHFLTQATQFRFLQNIAWRLGRDEVELAEKLIKNYTDFNDTFGAGIKK